MNRSSRTAVRGLALAGAAALALALFSSPAAGRVPLGADLVMDGSDDDALSDGSDDDALYGVTDVVVKLKPGETIEVFSSRWRTSVIDQVGSLRIYLLQPPQDTTAEELASQMESDPALEWVEPNYSNGQPEGDPTYKWGEGNPRVVGNDPGAWTEQPALTTVRAREAHDKSTGVGTVVAVADTGFQLNHPGLVGRLASGGYDFVDNDGLPAEAANGTDDDNDGRIDEGRGHGTHVAGIVLAVAPGSRIMPLRVLDDEGRGHIWMVAEAIWWASAHGADVINLSLGTDVESELLSEAVDDAEDEDIVVVASAGNDAQTQPQWPAADDEVLAVASTSRDDQRSPFSNYGSWVDVAAPGQAIISTFPASVYARWDGTSMAAPFVAGQAALLRAQRPEADEDLLIRRIRSTAVPVGSGLGAGRIDLLASVLR